MEFIREGASLYIPATQEERQQMLSRIGIESIDELFESIPEEYRLQTLLNLPRGLSEYELTHHLTTLSRKNQPAGDAVCFLGGGCYDHFVPAVVDVVSSRSEYYTAYTPYQPEVSQGTLQTSFEFQTMICELTGLDVSNASLYEGATAAVEGINLAIGATGRTKKVIISEAVNPEYRQTIATYFANLPTEIVTIPAPAGKTDLAALEAALDDQTAGILIQSPNFFGIIEPVEEFATLAKEKGALTIQAFDPLSLGLLRRPGHLGVDVAIAEGQGLGTPMSYGGPFLGLFACRIDQVRRVPGRIVGETLDRRGNRCFVLTLQTREQHIRREKATSNICTNQGLLALRAAVYLALMGPQGMKEVSELCWHKAHYAAEQFAKIPGVKLRFDAPFFKEFVIEVQGSAQKYVDALLVRGFHAGIPLAKWYPKEENSILVAVTEKRTKEEIDALVTAWREVLNAR